MVRGRNIELTELRFLLEILVNETGQVQTSKIAKATGYSDQTVRNRAKQLQEDGIIDIVDVGSGHTYRLTDEGFQYLKTELRKRVD